MKAAADLISSMVSPVRPHANKKRGEATPTPVPAFAGPPVTIDSTPAAPKKPQSLINTQSVLYGDIEPKHRVLTSLVWTAKGGCFEPVYDESNRVRVAARCVTCSEAGIEVVIPTKSRSGTSELWPHASSHGIVREAVRLTIATAPASLLELFCANRLWMAARIESNMSLDASAHPLTRAFVAYMGQNHIAIGAHEFLKERHLIPMYNEAVRVTSEELKSALSYSVQLDFWSSKSGGFPQEFMGVTVVFSPPTFPEIRIVALGATAVRGPHPVPVTLEMLDTLLAVFGASRSPKLAAVTTDNALRPLLNAALKKSPWIHSLGCIDHIFNLSVCDVFDYEKVEYGVARAKSILSAVHDAMTKFSRKPTWAVVLGKATMDQFDEFISPVVDIEGRWYSRMDMLVRAELLIRPMRTALMSEGLRADKEAQELCRLLADVEQDIPFLVELLLPVYKASLAFEQEDAHIGEMFDVISTLEQKLKVRLCSLVASAFTLS